jgi:hypothetical protein
MPFSGREIPAFRLQLDDFLRSLALFLAVAMHLGVTGSAVAQDKPTFARVSTATQVVADPYFDAYIARDWSRLEPLLANEAHFVDPTAQLVFGSVDIAGKSAVMKNFRENYAAIGYMSFKKVRSFCSGEYAVFEGSLDWSLALGDGRTATTTGMPFVSVLRVVNGQVVAHQDLADYSFFLAAARLAKSSARDDVSTEKP